MKEEYLKLLNENFPDYKIPKTKEDIAHLKIVTKEDLSRLEKIRKTDLP